MEFLIGLVIRFIVSVTEQVFIFSKILQWFIEFIAPNSRTPVAHPQRLWSSWLYFSDASDNANYSQQIGNLAFARVMPLTSNDSLEVDTEDFLGCSIH